MKHKLADQKGFFFWLRRMLYGRMLLLIPACLCLLLMFYIMYSSWFPHVSSRGENYESPALMSEFPESEIPCTTDASDMYPTTKEQYSVILGLRSESFISTIQDHLQQGYGVLAVSTQTDSLKASFGDLQQVLQHNSKFVVIGTASRCNKTSLGTLFDQYPVDKVTIMYDSADFVPYVSSSETSASVACLIDLLEVVANHKDGKYKGTQILVHHSPEKVPPYIPYVHTSNVETEPFFTLKQRTPNAHCTAKFDYKEYYDVFLKSIEVYTTTYLRLYDLKVKRVVV